MDITYTEEVTKKVVSLIINVAVRYDEEDMPKDAPMRDGDSWIAEVDLDTKQIGSWPIGKTLSFKDMKICDQGRYVLRGKGGEKIKVKCGYVPNNLLPGDYGDYLSLDIDENGIITNWLPHADFSDFMGDED
jgi:hypothetical protein